MKNGGNHQFSTLDAMGMIPAPPGNLKYVKKSPYGSVKNLTASIRSNSTTLSGGRKDQAAKSIVSSKLSTTSRHSTISSKFE